MRRHPLCGARRRGVVLPALLTVALWPAAAATRPLDGGVARPQPRPPSNVLVILADDLGVDALERYGVNPGATAGLTPNLDRIMDAGVTFQNAWANPTCSPSRASLLTGRHAFRTGIGRVVTGGAYSLQASELTIPEMLRSYAGAAGYASAAFGKWHVEGSQTPRLCAPTEIHGFDLFEGTLDALPPGGGCVWDELVCVAGLGSTTTPVQAYMPERVVQAAIGWLGLQSAPWFCLLEPQAPYESAHVPPTSLQSVVTGSPCQACPTSSRVCYDAELQALDTKIGDLLAALGPAWTQHTTIFFLGDNGSPANEQQPFWPLGQSKGTLFEGGIRVPFVVSGAAVDPGLWGSRSDELASITDVFRTVAGVAGASVLPPEVAQDSVDLGPLLRAPAARDGSIGGVSEAGRRRGRRTLFADEFATNGPGPERPGHQMAIRDRRYKLLYDCSSALPLGLFDLALDPRETMDLLPSEGGLPPPGTPSGDAARALLDELAALTGCAIPQH